MHMDGKEYQDIVEERKDIIIELKKLEKDEKVQRYIYLKEENDKLLEQQIVLDTKLKADIYRNCDHVWVTSQVVHNDYLNSKGLYRCGCIKCGLDQRVLDNESAWLSYSDRIMHDCLTSDPGMLHRGIKAPIACDLELAQAIYCKIKDAHPDIDDKTLVKYLDISLTNIRSKEPNHEQEEHRAKRLQLRHSFRNWHEEDINRY